MVEYFFLNVYHTFFTSSKKSKGNENTDNLKGELIDSFYIRTYGENA